MSPRVHTRLSVDRTARWKSRWGVHLSRRSTWLLLIALVLLGLGVTLTVLW